MNLAAKTLERAAQKSSTRLGRVALVAAIVGLVLCAVGLGAMLSEMVAPPGFDGLPVIWLIALLGCAAVGACCVAIGLALGLVALIRSRKRGRAIRGAVWALVLGVAGAVALYSAVWLANQPPYVRYGVHVPPAAQRARLDRLDPTGVVRTYFQSRDLSVEYWLEGEASRAFWHESNFVPDFSLLAGIDRLRLSPVADQWDPSDADHRTFYVTYRTRVTDSIGDPPGPFSWYVHLERRPGGPWRIASMDDGS